MRIALAQIKSKKGNLIENREEHLKWIRKAASQTCEAIFFPELSLCGYEPTLAKSLALSTEDPYFNVFSKTARDLSIHIGLGYPLKYGSDLHIAMALFSKDGAQSNYAKQYLHADEQPYFKAGRDSILLEWGALRILPAICYEALKAEHNDLIDSYKANLYLASVAKPENGIKKAHQHFPQLAKAKGLPVLMVNTIGPSDNFWSNGQSAVWNSGGKLIAQLAAEEEGLLIVDL